MCNIKEEAKIDDEVDNISHEKWRMMLRYFRDELMMKNKNLIFSRVLVHVHSNQCMRLSIWYANSVRWAISNNLLKRRI